MAGIGFDAYVASQFDDPRNRRRGLARYVAITARALATYQPGRYAITTADGRFESCAILVSLANSAQFGNGARIAPGARVDDGWLDLVVVEERSRWRTVCQMPRLFTGSVGRIPGCSIRRIQEATIEGDRPMVFHVDGEPVQGGNRLTARVHPGALWVAVK
jgi:diacylglycerol kinase family enzyme